MLLHFARPLSVLLITFLLFTFYATCSTQNIRRKQRNGPETLESNKRVSRQHQQYLVQVVQPVNPQQQSQAVGYIAHQVPGYNAYHTSYSPRKRGYKYPNPKPPTTTKGYISTTTQAPKRPTPAPTRPTPGVEYQEEIDSVGLFPPDKAPPPVSPSRDFFTTTPAPLALAQTGWDIRDSIPGQPQRDYPLLSKIPRTSFSCEGKIPGFYADPETRCQVFHRCNDCSDQPNLQMESFLCPNGTEFNQQILTCDWWANVQCPESEKYFGINTELGAVYEDGTYAYLSAARRPPAVKKVAPGIIPPEEREPLPAELRTTHHGDGQHGPPPPVNVRPEIPKPITAAQSSTTTRRPGSRRTTTTTTASPPQSFISSDSSDYFDEASGESRDNIPARLSNLEEYKDDGDESAIGFRANGNLSSGKRVTTTTDKSTTTRNDVSPQANELPDGTKPTSFIVNRINALPNVEEPQKQESTTPKSNKSSTEGSLVFPPESTTKKPNSTTPNLNPTVPPSKGWGTGGYSSPNDEYLTPRKDFEKPNDEYLPPRKDLEKPTDEYLPPRNDQDNTLHNDYLPPRSGYDYRDLDRYVTAPPPPPKDSYEPIPDSYYRQPSNGYGTPSPNSYGAPPPTSTSPNFYGPPQPPTAYNHPAPSTSYGQPQPSTSYAQPQPSPIYNQLQGVTSNNQPQPVSSYNQPQPVSSYNHPPRVSSYNHPPPVSSYSHPPPVSSYSHPPPVSSYSHPPPVSLYNQPQPASSSNQPQPVSSYNQPQPASSSNQPQPVSSYNQPQPASSSNQPQPVSSYNQPQPASSSNQPHPASSFNQPHPASSFNQPQPGTLLTQSQTLTTHIQPQTAISYSQQQTGTSYSQPQIATSYNQPQQPISSYNLPSNTYGEPPKPSASFGEPPQPQVSFGEPPTPSAYTPAINPQLQLLQPVETPNVQVLTRPSGSSVQPLQFSSQQLNVLNHHQNHPHVLNSGQLLHHGKR